jgi:hypothetical protein
MLDVAALELNALAHAGVWPGTTFEGARMRMTPTPIHDVDGELLYVRVPIGGGRIEGHVDVAASAAFAQPIVGLTLGKEWSERGVIAEATEHAKRQRKGLQFDDVRLVAYSHPKLAVQFLADGQEVAMLEVGSWTPVPPARTRKAARRPATSSAGRCWARWIRAVGA